MTRFGLTIPLLLTAVTASAQPLPPVVYTLSFPAPHTHYVEVEAQVPTAGRAQVELMMPVWTPGSYLVREFARHVEEVRAEAGGRALPVAKSRKNRWRIDTGGAWYETGTDPVIGRVMAPGSAFIRCMVLDAELLSLKLRENDPER